jgi:hypothetical protein
LIIETPEDLIKSYIPLVNGKTGKGWYRIFCAVCGDGSRTKGPRGGWIFENGSACYNCFNCGISGTFDLNREYPFSKDMRKILNAFEIPANEYNKLVFFKKSENKDTPEKIKKPTIQYIEKPDYFLGLEKAPLQFIKKVDDFLYKNYRLRADCYPFFYCTGHTHSASPRDVALSKAFVNRIIIPYYKNGNLVHYEGRSLDPETKPKYLSAGSSRSSSLYGFDKLFIDEQHPLYILEGFFDAFHVDGVAVFQNKMSQSQIDFLNSSPRQKIVIPDNKNDSNKLVEQAIENKWDVSFPDIGNCKDISEAILKYGSIYVATSIVNNIKNADETTFLKNFKNIR